MKICVGEGEKARRQAVSSVYFVDLDYFHETLQPSAGYGLLVHEVS
jgi:hypothetical protein